MPDVIAPGSFDGHSLDEPYNGSEVVLAHHDGTSDEECQWDSQYHTGDPECVEPDPEPDPECDPWAGLVVAEHRDGCVVESMPAEPWIEVGAFAGVLVLVMLSALVVAQLRR